MGENGAIGLAVIIWTAILSMLVSAHSEGERSDTQMAQTREGAAKIMAKRFGMSLDDYTIRNAAEKWCTGCKEWHERTAFGADSSRADGRASACLAHRKRMYTDTYVRSGRKSRAGIFLVPSRDGDKKQARARVNHAVSIGAMPGPNSLPCVDCGHEGEDKRHEYDHHMGYAAEHQLVVHAVCSSCHRLRENARAAEANRLPANARLSHEQVREIRSGDGTTKAIAAALGLDVETVRRVKVRETYRSVR